MDEFDDEWGDDFTEQLTAIAQLREQITQHPGQQAYKKWDALRRIHGVLARNEQDLLRLIDKVQGDDSLAIQIVQNVHQTGMRDAFNNELVRLLHNYLSALKMLVDHTRNLMRGYPETPTAHEYDRRIAAVVLGGRAPMMQKLRDYLIHYRIPPQACP